MGFFEIGIAAFIVAVVISRMLIQKANKHLSIEEKAKLVDLSGGLNSYGILVILPLVGIYWFLAKNTDIPYSALIIGYFFLALAFIIFLQVANYRRITNLKFPSQYVSTYLISRVVYLAGVVVFFAGLGYGFQSQAV